jgi:hypothetical protein
MNGTEMLYEQLDGTFV